MALGAVRDVLSEVLPSSQLTNVPLDDGNSPLLVLRTSQVLAGFGVSSNRRDPTGSYRILYEGFKNKYYEHQEEWDDLDPNFVFCVSPDLPGLEQFGSRVETDVYFCRKFVVPLNHPLENVLAQLPFLPLASAAGGSDRPLSAQTILRQSGMPALLAEHLVVQGRSGPMTIIKACIGGSYGDPKPISPVDRGLVPVDRSTGTYTRIRSVTIRNFRAYQKAQTFVLGDKITVLYGPNGFGKTSVFDAIDFAATGEIGRLGVQVKSRFNKVAAHLDGGAATSSVSLSLAKNGTSHEIVRSVSDRMHAKIDGQKSDRKAILSFLTSGHSEHIENFVRLFRSMHLFSQEKPELARGFGQDCTLPIEVISRLLSFEDYSNALSKIREIQRILEKQIATAAERLESLKGQLAKAQEDFQRVGKIALHEQSSIELDELTRSLGKRISDVGIEVMSDKADVRTLVSWRSILAARSETLKASVPRWSDLIEDAVALPMNRVKLAGLEKEISDKNESLAKLTNQGESLRKSRERIKNKIDELVQDESRLDSRLRNLSWLKQTTPVYVDLRSRQETAIKLVAELSEAAERLGQKEKNALRKLRENEAELKQLSAELDSLRERHTSVGSMIEACDGWTTQQKRVPEISRELQSKAETLEQLRADIRQATGRRDEFAHIEASLSRRIEAADKVQSELEGLVSKIQRHLHTGVCPVCEYDHGSLDALLDRIGNRKEQDSASAERIELTKARAENRNASDNLARLEVRQSGLQRELGTLRETRDRILSETQAFKEKAEQLGVKPSTHSMRRQLTELNDSLTKDVSRLEEEWARKRKDAATSTKAMVEASRAEKAKRDEAGSQDRLVIEFQDKIDRLVDDPRLGQESIELPTDEIDKRIRTVRQELSNVKNARTTASSDLEAQERAVERVRRQAAILQADIMATQKRADAVAATCRDISAQFRDEGLPKDVSEEGLRSRIAGLENEKARLDKLHQEVTEAELALDEAATRAAFIGLRESIGEQENAITKVQESRNLDGRWLKYFNTASDILSKQQGLAVSHFTDSYGPQASVIQRRLRSVPGFEDIEVTSEKSAIRVRARRQNDELRPTDYFSQSQQQTLLLGLFLSACLSQSWSSFSPILLDDPVTHCDDLNAYAFLDLLAGLTESELTRRQVVISTCDDRFLHLARRKFRHLGSEAKYYTFQAIGKDGPVVLPLD